MRSGRVLPVNDGGESELKTMEVCECRMNNAAVSPSKTELLSGKCQVRLEPPPLLKVASKLVEARGIAAERPFPRLFAPHAPDSDGADDARACNKQYSTI